jgi:hypothetical protein
MNTIAAPFAYLADAPAVELPPSPPIPAGAEQDAPASFADRCAHLALELRTALEDRLPTVAALAACWFDDDDDDDAGSQEQVKDPVFVRVDLETLAAGLVRRDGHPATADDAAAWLNMTGFRRAGDLWAGERDDLRLICGQAVCEIVSAGDA